MINTIVTREDYLNEFGIDLFEELNSVVSIDDPTNVVEYFISRIEKRVKYFLRTQRAWDGTFKTDHQLQCFKDGILAQIEYALEMGTIHIRDNRGERYTLEELIKIQYSIHALDCFRLGGLANLRRY